MRLYLFFLLSAFSLSVWAGQTTALYQPASLVVGPFPSNVTTKTDYTQLTGLRVDLPSTTPDVCDPSSSPSVCSNSALLNQLDGFSVNPRLMVCFSAAVDPTTLKDGIHIVPLDGGSPWALIRLFSIGQANVLSPSRIRFSISRANTSLLSLTQFTTPTEKR